MEASIDEKIANLCVELARAETQKKADMACHKDEITRIKQEIKSLVQEKEKEGDQYGATVTNRG